MDGVKYPRTRHLPWSKGATSDDKWMDCSALKGQLIVITEKMDGENTTMTPSRVYARSLDSVHHDSRSYIKGLHASIKANIPDDMRICGENLYARHTIEYNDLTSYFQVFSAWFEDVCLDWSTTLEWCELLGLTTVPVIFEGLFDETWLKELASSFPRSKEGYVVRLRGAFKLADFSSCVGKYVREGHVQTNEHWMHNKIVPNRLKS